MLSVLIYSLWYIAILVSLVYTVAFVVVVVVVVVYFQEISSIQIDVRLLDWTMKESVEEFFATVTGRDSLDYILATGAGKSIYRVVVNMLYLLY